MEGSPLLERRRRRRRAAWAAALGGLLTLGAFAPTTPAGAQEPPADEEAPAQEGDAPPEGDEGEAPGEGATQFLGRLRYENSEAEEVGVEGVEIEIESEDGSFSETVETDEEGAYQVTLPGPGRYSATIDVASLPDGVDMVDEDKTTLNVNMSAGQSRSLLFRISTGEAPGEESKLEQVPEKVVDGLRFGLIIAMCAIGLSLIFGTTGLVNFAHGDMVTFGALMAFLFNRTLGLHLLIAAPLGIVAGGLFGGVFNRAVWRPLRNRGTGLVAMMIVSFGIGLALRYAYLFQFQGQRRSYGDFDYQPSGIDVGPVEIIPRHLWIMGISIVVLVGVALFLERTRLGKAMRAVSDDSDLAESSGIDVERVIAWVWITGGGLAALGGIFQGLDQKIQWQTGNQLLLLIFAGVILGGLGTSYGALVGSVTIGLLIQLSTLVVSSELRTASALLVMIVVLLIRPQGILGYSERVG